MPSSGWVLGPPEAGEDGRSAFLVGTASSSRRETRRDASARRCPAPRWRGLRPSGSKIGAAGSRRPGRRAGCRDVADRPGWRAAGGGPGSRSPDGAESAWPRGASAGGADSNGKASRSCCATQAAVGVVLTAQRTTSCRSWRMTNDRRPPSGLKESTPGQPPAIQGVRPRRDTSSTPGAVPGDGLRELKAASTPGRRRAGSPRRPWRRRCRTAPARSAPSARRSRRSWW